MSGFNNPLLSLVKRLTRKKTLNYEQRFDQALNRTKAWGQETVGFNSTKQFFDSPENLQIFHEIVSAHLSHRQAEEVSQQCFAVNLALKTPLEDALGVPLTFTLGYVELEGRNVFHTDIRELKAMLRHGMPSPAVNLHAWLTLPSHEVIDMTFGTTYGVVTNTPSCIGKMCFLHPDKMTDSMQYRPQLIGEDYLEQIGCMRTLMVLS
ncbi:hypothetical protein ALQ57_200046 [Pseudomonas amygdali pv. hibisci]|uniref:Integrase n=1 Tax=Pseudomonas amygdali pv. hibisci TaxID=251723 RepID=A0AB34UFK4_PSEA0|nr:hypothetical protein [Pseudomonas amygdali]KPX58908.1 hypothetical protein ALO67_200077 [Pseudomonas amygdali pv. hibisci]RMN54967.1 hypothetical protein ALQ57_200046 [Pseudomonas amygdali pv. hibisci]